MRFSLLWFSTVESSEATEGGKVPDGKIKRSVVFTWQQQHHHSHHNHCLAHVIIIIKPRPSSKASQKARAPDFHGCRTPQHWAEEDLRLWPPTSPFQRKIRTTRSLCSHVARLLKQLDFNGYCMQMTPLYRRPSRPYCALWRHRRTRWCFSAWSSSSPSPLTPRLSMFMNAPWHHKSGNPKVCAFPAKCWQHLCKNIILVTSFVNLNTDLIIRPESLLRHQPSKTWVRSFPKQVLWVQEPTGCHSH